MVCVVYCLKLSLLAQYWCHIFSLTSYSLICQHFQLLSLGTLALWQLEKLRCCSLSISTAGKIRRPSSIITFIHPSANNNGNLQPHYRPTQPFPVRRECRSSSLPALHKENLPPPPPAQERMASTKRSTRLRRIPPVSRSSGSTRRDGMAVLSSTSQHVYPYAGANRDGGFA